jgi:hypothetical protein
MALMLAKTYAAFKAAEVPEGSLPAEAELLDAVAAIDRVLVCRSEIGSRDFRQSGTETARMDSILACPGDACRAQDFPARTSSQPSVARR